MENNEIGRLMALKAALVATTHTTGWHYIKQIADNVVKQAVQAAITEEDDVKGASLRRKAKNAQEIFHDLFATIETSMTFNTDQEPDWFAQLAFDSETESQESSAS